MIPLFESGGPSEMDRSAPAELFAPLLNIPGVKAMVLGDVSEEKDIYLFKIEHSGSGSESIPIGFFAGIHGDEPAGVHALIKLIQELVANPDLASGYELFFLSSLQFLGLETKQPIFKKWKGFEP